MIKLTVIELQALAQRLFPQPLEDPESILSRYPQRSLPDGAMVTRFAPSPTGFIHFGSMFPVMVCERLAHQSGGIFYLRIEDTDQKREVAGGVENIIESFREYQIYFDEGAVADGERGAYGPYRQRQRAAIYQSFARALLLKGRAYPCFCTEEELATMREEQELEKENYGYYGKWAVWANASFQQISAKLDENVPWVLRFRSLGDPSKRFQHRDLVKGTLDLPENDQDIVLLKSDGIPTYHFAHVIDDTLMHTTHVVRGDEWLATLPIHLQLFRALDWRPPKYLHISPLMKQDGDSKRKISKRHDPEAAMSFYAQEGFPVASVKEYVMTLLNSDYEEWRRSHPSEPLEAFPFSAKKMSPSGALFDFHKLIDVSKNTIAALSAQEVFDQLLKWTHQYDPSFYTLLSQNPEYAKKILSIGRGGKKPRKDFATWKEAKDYMAFFYDALFSPDYRFPEHVSRTDCAAILRSFMASYKEDVDSTVWFDNIKKISQDLGFCPEVKVFKADPSPWKGHVGDVSMVLRVAVTGRQNAPDLYAVLQILGKERVYERIEDVLTRIS